MSDQTIPHINVEHATAVLYAPANETVPNARIYYDLYTLISHYSTGIIAAHKVAHETGRLDHQHQVEGARQLLVKMSEDLETLTLLAEFTIPDDLGGLDIS